MRLIAERTYNLQEKITMPIKYLIGDFEKWK